MVSFLTAVQAEAARGAQDYVTAAVQRWGASSDPAGTVNTAALAGVAADGRPLDSLLSYPAFQVDAFVANGMDPGQAMAIGQRHLERIATTETQDAARAATGVAQVNDRAVHGYVRMLTPPSCSRCAVLAGKFYQTNAGFERHPQCDCVHIPAVEYLPDLSTDPKRYFDSLSPEEQDRAFTIAGAKAIRDGADISQVVNARRGATGIGYAAGRLTDAERTMLRGGRQRGHLDTTNVLGHDLYTTTEASTTRGVAGVRLGAKETGKKTAGSRYRRAQIPRLMPESIYSEAERLGWSRDEIVRQLKRFGYIL
ncbi:MAG: hypothetical protein JWO67_2495 [Streptosporangiaceae bacterium]|nr:hypothetical protein [Streptosporangiaceae bacterium]